jgi:ferredoxin-NADP reductase
MALEHEARLLRIVEHSRETRSLFLRPSSLPRLVFRPGQFVSCLLPVGGETLIRPYSIASDPEDDVLELCLDLVPGGPGSAHLFALAPGATVRFTGPWGTFVLDDPPAAETVFVADGTGIAPIRPMLRRALARPGSHPVRLLQGVLGEDRVLYGADLGQLLRAHPRFAWEHVPSSRLAGEVTRRWIDADRDRSRHFFVCGVGAIVPALRDLLRGAGYVRRAVQYEKW